MTIGSMTGTASLIYAAIQPVVAQTAFGGYYSKPPSDALWPSTPRVKPST